MTASKRSLFVRSMYVGRDLELFLVTAVATILIVRSVLGATGWPQLGGGKIHFALLLWGGLGMFIPLILFVSMEGRVWKVLATFAAGIGFGLFIDELGKFITSDNDYFFKPTIAIIYVVFVVPSDAGTTPGRSWARRYCIPQPVRDPIAGLARLPAHYEPVPAPKRADRRPDLQVVGCDPVIRDSCASLRAMTPRFVPTMTRYCQVPPPALRIGSSSWVTSEASTW
jgi:hypothetical protein